MMKPTKYWLWSILILSVLLRVGIAFYYGDVVDAPPLLTDQRSYHWLGVRILEGKGYSFPKAWYPFTAPDTPTAHWSFLYSLFVAGVYAVFGTHPLAARVVQAVLGGVLLPWMVYRLASGLNAKARERKEEDGVRWVPLVAALWAAGYPYFAMYGATMMTETFYIVALLWSLDVALRMGRELREGARVPWAVTVQLGLSLGIAAVLRQSILPWVPVLFGWLVVMAAWGQGVRKAAGLKLADFRLRSLVPLVVAGSIMIACIVPWTVRNAVVYDRFLLLNSNTGYAMYSAQHPMHGTRFREFDAAPLPEGFARGSEAEMDKVLMGLGIGFVLEDPVRYLRLSLSRVRAYLEFWPTPDTTLVHNLGRVGSFGVALPFMVSGIGMAVGQAFGGRKSSGRGSGAGEERQAAEPRFGHAISNTGRRLDLALILIFIVFYSVLHIFTWAMVRYRLPVDAVAMPFAALALVAVCERIAGILNVKAPGRRETHRIEPTR